MSGFGTLVQKDQPFVTYCQAFNCAQITMNLNTDTAAPIYFLQPYIESITLSIEYSGTVYGGADIKDDIITVLTGAFAVTAWSDQMTGIGTLFTTELTPGDYVFIEGKIFRVFSIESDTSLTMTSISNFTISDRAGYKHNLTYSITPSFFGWTIDYIPEGTYEMTLTVTYVPAYHGGQSIIDLQSIQIYCEKYCCVYNKLADLADICGDCMDQDNIKKIVEALFMWGLLESYKGSAGCGDSVSLTALQARLDRYCNYQPCTHC